MFTTKGIEVASSAGKYIPYGVHEVIIASVDAKESENGSSPAFFLNFKETKGDRVLNVRCAMTDKASKYSLSKIRHIGEILVGEAAIDGVRANTVTEYAAAITPLICNKPIRVLFMGEEQQGKEGRNNWYKSMLGFAPFAESIDQNPSQLVFDANRHIKKLPETTSVPTEQDGSDLLF